MLAFDDSEKSSAIIKVVGVGGAGMNALERIAELNLRGVELIAMNTDEQVLRRASANVKVSLGNKSSRGLGAGADPTIGQKAAKEVRDRIHEVLLGSDMVFITAGMGGGTGTGASPIIAEVAREIDALTVGVVTMPFKSEGAHKREIARQGQAELRSKVNTLITIPNDSIFKVIDRKTSLRLAFKAIDDVLAKSVIGISDIINSAGDVNVDFADVKTVMSRSGDAVIGVGEGTGDERVTEALQQAVSHPLLEGRRIDGATAVLINVVAGSDLSMVEYNDILEALRKQVSERAQIINGFREDSHFENQLSVTVIATGFHQREQAPTLRKIEGGSIQQTGGVSQRGQALGDEITGHDLSLDSKPKIVTDENQPNSSKRGYYPIQGIDQENENIDQQDLDFPEIKVPEKNFNIPAFLRKKG